jgi:hypothetical protein
MSNAAQIEVGSVLSLAISRQAPGVLVRSWNSSMDVEELLKLLQDFS